MPKAVLKQLKQIYFFFAHGIGCPGFLILFCEPLRKEFSARRHVFRVFVLTLLTAGSVFTCVGNHIIPISDQRKVNLIGKRLQCFPDTSNSVSISDLLSKPDAFAFKPLPNDINTFPLLTSTLWFKFEVINLSSGSIYLEVGEPSVNYIELYKMNPSGEYVQKKAGYFSPFSSREVVTNNYLFNLETAKDSISLFFLRIQMKKKETITVPLAVGSLKSFLERNHKNDLLGGIFYGYMLLVVLFNSIMYVSSKDRSYLYFSLHVAVAALWVANYYGIAFEFLWGNLPVVNQFTPTITSASCIFVILFSRIFLRTVDYAPKLHKGLYLLLWGFAAAVLLNVLDYYYASMVLVEVFAFLMCIYLSGVAIYVYRNGFTPALIYMAALMTFFTGIIVFLLQINGLLSASFITRNSVPIGLGLEIGMISFAMGNRLRFYRMEKKKTQSELIESYEANQRLLYNLREQELKSMTAVLEMQENERHRIASDLHDRLGSMLSTVKIYFSSVEDKMSTLDERHMDQYHKASSLLDETCDELRKISHDLASGELVTLGLVSALNQMISTIDGVGALKINFLTTGMQLRLETSVEISLYRIIQELMNNILKHSKATEVLLQLNRSGNNLNIMLEDNGSGFDIDSIQVHNGMGLKNIKTRLSKLQGELSIDSRKGRGTITIIDIPV